MKKSFIVLFLGRLFLSACATIDYIFLPSPKFYSQTSQQKKFSHIDYRPIHYQISAGEIEETREYLLSAGDTNSTASAVFTRHWIKNGGFISKAMLRMQDFLNYYQFKYLAPKKNFINFIAEMYKGKENSYSLQIALRSKNVSREKMQKINLVIAIDTSGSMHGNRITLAKKMLLSLISQLRDGNFLTLISFDSQAKTLIPPLQKKNSMESIIKIIDSLYADGGTNLDAGLLLAYQEMTKRRNPLFQNRVIVLTDRACQVAPAINKMIYENAKDINGQGTYLMSIGVGEGFNRQLLDHLTTIGKGTSFFLKTEADVHYLIRESTFLSGFNLAVKDIKLKMKLPPGWVLDSSLGSTPNMVTKEDLEIKDSLRTGTVSLFANSQILYHLRLRTNLELKKAHEEIIEFSLQYTPVNEKSEIIIIKKTVKEILGNHAQVKKGAAIAAYADMFIQSRYPLLNYREDNYELAEKTIEQIRYYALGSQDKELRQIIQSIDKYRSRLNYTGRYKSNETITKYRLSNALDLPHSDLRSIKRLPSWQAKSTAILTQLGNSHTMIPLKGSQFLAMSTGPINNPTVAGTNGQLSKSKFSDPTPLWQRMSRSRFTPVTTYDLQQVTIRLRPPVWAKSFSFDFLFFSAEFPNYTNQKYNDTFYAILESPSINQGEATNISFDPASKSINVKSSFFTNPVRSVTLAQSGFDYHGSSGWLRTFWPIKGGETFTLTFSLHDAGDALFDSLVLIDNIQWNREPSQPMTVVFN